MPRVLALGRWWSADELDAIARRWRTEVAGRLGEPEGLIATALPVSVDGVALFAALLSLPSTLVLLSVDIRAWRTNPPLPAGLPVILPPSQATLGPGAARPRGR